VSGELVAVNCAAIPAGLAERLLFGTRKGAYSGADRDADGYLAAADGGTLFLDEVAELDLDVQAKLLRVLETGELLALGAARPRAVQLRVVAATLRDLRAAVAAGRFRDDLYYRIGRPEVRLPPLRERLEEIPWLVRRGHRQPRPARAPVADRGVPVAAVARQRARAQRRGRARRPRGDRGRPPGGARRGARRAGRPPHVAAAAPADPAEPKRRSVGLPDDDDAILAALRAEGGNVSRAARRLGVAPQPAAPLPGQAPEPPPRWPPATAPTER
jgi:transcriptional regulator with GAF, ATPase, and Fis domain